MIYFVYDSRLLGRYRSLIVSRIVINWEKSIFHDPLVTIVQDVWDEIARRRNRSKKRA